MTESIELRHLRYFVAVADQLNFARAARQLGISQPVLSRQIQQLEQRLGVALLERTNHMVHLTSAGRVFLAESQRTMEQLHRSFELTQRAHRGELGKLILGMAPFLDDSVSRRIKENLKTSFPHLKLECLTFDSDEQASLVRDGRLDAGLVRLPLKEHDGLTLEYLSREALAVMVADRSKFGKRRTIHLAELCGQSVVGIEGTFSSTLHRYFDSVCHKRNLPAKHRNRVHFVSTIPDFVQAIQSHRVVGLGPACLEREVGAGIQFLQVRDRDASGEIGLIFRRDNNSHAFRSFLNMVHQIDWFSCE